MKFLLQNSFKTPPTMILGAPWILIKMVRNALSCLRNWTSLLFPSPLPPLTGNQINRAVKLNVTSEKTRFLDIYPLSIFVAQSKIFSKFVSSFEYTFLKFYFHCIK